jgi:hypothetical protein
MKRRAEVSLPGGHVSVRRITNGGKKVIGKFPSLKMGRAVWWESQIERDFIYFLEADTGITEYKEQPLKIWYSWEGKRHKYTPDYFVRRYGRKQIYEVKDYETASSEEFNLFSSRVSPIFEALGYEYLVVTDREIRQQPVLDNLKLLHKYSRTRLSYQHQIDVYAFFSLQRESSLGQLRDYMRSRGVQDQVLYALIYWGILSIDLNSPIGLQSQISMPGNKCYY